MDPTLAGSDHDLLAEPDGGDADDLDDLDALGSDGQDLPADRTHPQRLTEEGWKPPRHAGRIMRT